MLNKELNKFNKQNNNARLYLKSFEITNIYL